MKALHNKKKEGKQGMKHSGRETEFCRQEDGRRKRFRRQLGGISLASYFLTADRGNVSRWHNCTALAILGISWGHLYAQWWYLKCKEIRRHGKMCPHDGYWSKISGPVCDTWSFTMFFFLSLRSLVGYGSSNSLWHIHTKHGQMMSLWWNAPNADRLSKPEREGQRQF